MCRRTVSDILAVQRVAAVVRVGPAFVHKSEFHLLAKRRAENLRGKLLVLLHGILQGFTPQADARFPRAGRIRLPAVAGGQFLGHVPVPVQRLHRDDGRSRGSFHGKSFLGFGSPPAQRDDKHPGRHVAASVFLFIDAVFGRHGPGRNRNQQTRQQQDHGKKIPHPSHRFTLPEDTTSVCHSDTGRQTMFIKTTI